MNYESEMSDTMIILKSLGNCNPGAYTVVTKIIDVLNTDDSKSDMIIKLMNILLDKNITGARLWYIYKNEANFNINNLFELNLNKFDENYFYDTFEKYN